MAAKNSKISPQIRRDIEDHDYAKRIQDTNSYMKNTVKLESFS